MVQPASQWLKSRQNDDGGWGETLLSHSVQGFGKKCSIIENKRLETLIAGPFFWHRRLEGSIEHYVCCSARVSEIPYSDVTTSPFIPSPCCTSLAPDIALPFPFFAIRNRRLRIISS
ncbi:hypothetical protein GJ744_008148 [Endocarpon pusillum]|uniref:Uncharacterized protein n=1 Tax=Endocarpon pusillum TaxID=364733 RepID=A0A8H7AKV3_9EURO|nr:hypothetical protein GJ744_008148 [Endocarpon pusillum]